MKYISFSLPTQTSLHTYNVHHKIYSYYIMPRCYPEGFANGFPPIFLLFFQISDPFLLRLGCERIPLGRFLRFKAVEHAHGRARLPGVKNGSTILRGEGATVNVRTRCGCKYQCELSVVKSSDRPSTSYARRMTQTSS